MTRYSRRKPVTLSKLTIPGAWPWRGRLRFRLVFGSAEGPAQVTDGRGLMAELEGRELADLLDTIPVKELDTGGYLALRALTGRLRGEQAVFTGARTDDLLTVLALARPAPDAVLSEADRAALTRLRDATDHLEPAPADGVTR